MATATTTTPPLAFRPARATDLAAMVALLADDEIGRTHERVAKPLAHPYVAAFAAIAASSEQLLLVGEAAGAVVACLQLSFIPGLSYLGSWRAQIEGVRVARDRRGQGIGSAMLRHAIELARRRGCRMVQLTTDKRRLEARRFYERLGFVATHEGMKLTLA